MLLSIITREKSIILHYKKRDEMLRTITVERKYNNKKSVYLPLSFSKAWSDSLLSWQPPHTTVQSFHKTLSHYNIFSQSRTHNPHQSHPPTKTQFFLNEWCIFTTIMRTTVFIFARKEKKNEGGARVEGGRG